MYILYLIDFKSIIFISILKIFITFHQFNYNVYHIYYDHSQFLDTYERTLIVFLFH